MKKVTKKKSRITEIHAHPPIGINRNPIYKGGKKKRTKVKDFKKLYS